MNLNWLQKFMRGGDKVRLDIEAQANGRFKVLVTPILKAAPENLSEEGQIIRGALSESVLLNVSAEELDGGLDAMLTKIADVREESQDAFEAVLAKMKEGAKKSANAAAKATKPAAAGAKKPAPDKKAAEPESEEDEKEAAAVDAQGEESADDDAAPAVAQPAAPAATVPSKDLFA